jgi:hypothetical protein
MKNTTKIDPYTRMIAEEKGHDVLLPFLMRIDESLFNEQILIEKGCTITTRIGCILACQASYTNILEIEKLEFVKSMEASR